MSFISKIALTQHLHNWLKFNYSWKDFKIFQYFAHLNNIYQLMDDIHYHLKACCIKDKRFWLNLVVNSHELFMYGFEFCFETSKLIHFKFLRFSDGEEPFGHEGTLSRGVSFCRSLCSGWWLKTNLTINVKEINSTSNEFIIKCMILNQVH